MEFAKNVRFLMTEKRLTVARLSEKSGIPAKTLYHWLSGQKPRHIEQVFLLCDVLDVNIETLYGRAGKPEPAQPGIRPSSEDLNAVLQSGDFEIVVRPVKKAEIS